MEIKSKLKQYFLSEFNYKQEMEVKKHIFNIECHNLSLLIIPLVNPSVIDYSYPNSSNVNRSYTKVSHLYVSKLIITNQGHPSPID